MLFLIIDLFKSLSSIVEAQPGKGAFAIIEIGYLFYCNKLMQSLKKIPPVLLLLLQIYLSSLTCVSQNQELVGWCPFAKQSFSSLYFIRNPKRKPAVNAKLTEGLSLLLPAQRDAWINHPPPSHFNFCPPPIYHAKNRLLSRGHWCPKFNIKSPKRWCFLIVALVESSRNWLKLYTHTKKEGFN